MPHCEQFFDPTDAAWKSDVGGSIILLQLSGELGSAWALELMSSATRMSVLEVNYAVGLFMFVSRKTGLLKWRELHTLRLHNVCYNGKNLKDFVDAHTNTLPHLDLSEVHLISGSWKDILYVLRKQLKLHSFTIDMLTETTAPTPHPKPFWNDSPRFEDLPPPKISFRTRAQIRATFKTLLHDFRTTDFQCSVGFDGSPMYRVDFRLACAVEMSWAEIRHGECHLLKL